MYHTLGFLVQIKSVMSYNSSCIIVYQNIIYNSSGKWFWNFGWDLCGSEGWDCAYFQPFLSIKNHSYGSRYVDLVWRQAREIYIKVLWRGGKSSPVCVCGVRPARTLTWTFLSKYIYDLQMFTDAQNCLCVFQDSRWIKFVPLHEEYHLFLFWTSCSVGSLSLIGPTLQSRGYFKGPSLVLPTRALYWGSHANRFLFFQFKFIMKVHELIF